MLTILSSENGTGLLATYKTGNFRVNKPLLPTMTLRDAPQKYAMTPRLSSPNSNRTLVIATYLQVPIQISQMDHITLPAHTPQKVYCCS
jgi:hypothetical protein